MWGEWEWPCAWGGGLWGLVSFLALEWVEEDGGEVGEGLWGGRGEEGSGEVAVYVDDPGKIQTQTPMHQRPQKTRIRHQYRHVPIPVQKHQKFIRQQSQN